MKENQRQSIHMGVSIIVLALLIGLGKTETTLILLTSLIVGSLVINLKILKKKVPLVDDVVGIFERDNTRFVGYGSAWLIVGFLLAITFLENMEQTMSIIWILGVGDGLSTIVGINGKHKLPYNKKKTIEGSLALFISSVLTYFLIGPVAILLAIATTIVESLPIPLDDNAAIPIVGIALLKILM